MRMPCLEVGFSPRVRRTVVTAMMETSDPCLDPLLWVFPPSHLHPSGLPQLPFCVAWCGGEEEWGFERLSLP